VKTADNKRFPAFLEFERGGRRVAVVGLVGQDDLDRVPAPMRAQFVVEPALEALPRILKEVLRERPTVPDVVVLLTNARDAELRSLQQAKGIDIIISDFADGDLFARTTRVNLPTPQKAGSKRIPSVIVHNAGSTVGLVRAHLTSDGLVAFDHESRPVLQEGPFDATVRAFIADRQPVGQASAAAVARRARADRPASVGEKRRGRRTHAQLPQNPRRQRSRRTLYRYAVVAAGEPRADRRG
jgi:hypothetical protein